MAMRLEDEKDCCSAYVASWHETDIPRCPVFGRYRGYSRHGPKCLEGRLLTHRRHRPISHVALGRGLINAQP